MHVGNVVWVKYDFAPSITEFQGLLVHILAHILKRMSLYPKHLTALSR